MCFFDGGQFAQIAKMTRRIMVPFLYLAIKSLYWSNGNKTISGTVRGVTEADCV